MKVFVYGTLKPGERNYPYYCEGKVVQTISAYTYGKLFDFPTFGYPAMTRGNDKVKGVLLTFTDDSVLTQLDELEGYYTGRSPSQNEYERQNMTVYTLGGESLGQAWVYIMTPEKVKQFGGVFLSSGWWTQQAE